MYICTYMCVYIYIYARAVGVRTDHWEFRGYDGWDTIGEYHGGMTIGILWYPMRYHWDTIGELRLGQSTNYESGISEGLTQTYSQL